MPGGLSHKKIPRTFLCTRDVNYYAVPPCLHADRQSGFMLHCPGATSLDANGVTGPDWGLSEAVFRQFRMRTLPARFLLLTGSGVLLWHSFLTYSSLQRFYESSAILNQTARIVNPPDRLFTLPPQTCCLYSLPFPLLRRMQEGSCGACRSSCYSNRPSRKVLPRERPASCSLP